MDELTTEVRLHIRGGRARGTLAIGPGKIALLEQIQRTGSITSAAKALKMSYRRAWMLVDETNRCVIGAAVETTAGGDRGGGTRLTPAGVALVRRYRALERTTTAAALRTFKTLLR